MEFYLNFKMPFKKEVPKWEASISKEKPELSLTSNQASSGSFLFRAALDLNVK